MSLFRKCDEYQAARALRAQGLYPYYRCISSPQEPVVRMLDSDRREVLGRLVEALRALPESRETDLVPHMKVLCDGTELTLKTFCPLAYDLLIGRDQGPKLTTLLATIGPDRALPLLEASLAA